FFSSRRRHTMSKRDWSSDVCSSDLVRGCSMNIVDLVQSQVIASVKREKDIHPAILSNANMIFLMKGDLQTTKAYVDRIKEANKTVFIHIDFIDGLANTKS